MEKTETIRALPDRLLLNTESGFRVVRYKGDGKTFLAVGTELPVVRDVAALLTGCWADDPRYGHQFKVSSFSTEYPSSEKGVISYLSSLGCRIGKKTGKRIYDRFGEGIWDILEKNPRALSSVSGIGDGTLQKLTERIEETALRRSIMARLGNHFELTALRYEKMLDAFGKDAILDILDKTPYRLCELAGFGFLSVDAMARAAGHPTDAEDRCDAAVLYALDENAVSGHTCANKILLISAMLRLLNFNLTSGETEVSEQHCRDAINRAFRRKAIMTTGDWIYSRRRWLEETETAKILYGFCRSRTDPVQGLPALIEEYEKENSISLAESQKAAVISVFQHRAVIITGGPGTGKSTTTKAILSCHKKVFGEGSKPLLLAPTGRAARRLAECTDYPASTIHSAIGYRNEELDRNGVRKNTLETNLVIVDEVSMVDQFIMHELLKQIPYGAKAVFVGDEDQLPSVGCGNVLHEMLRSGVIPCTRLDVIFRQAKENPIVENSMKIREGNWNLRYTNEFQFLQENTDEGIIRAALYYYLASVQAYGLDNVVLLNSYRDKTELSVNIFNLRLQEMLNPRETGKPEIKVSGSVFRLGDKVTQTVNTENAKNGDIGYIRKIWKDSEHGETFTAIEFNNDGNPVTYSTENMKNIQLAYCQTVHKSQGAQYTVVIMILSMKHKRLLRRNLIYTGITRATENVALIGQTEALKTAIRNNQMEIRNTLLGDRLHNLFEASDTKK